MKTTLGCLRKADTDFHLIEPGDRVAVGVSGGKDSLLLLHALSLYRKFSHKDFTLMAFTISMGLEPFDLSGIHRLCQELDIPYVVKQTEIGDIIFNKRKEKNPCALCAKMRRGALNDMCREYGCNKLALGHHRDDAIETLLMSLFYEGRFQDVPEPHGHHGHPPPVLSARVPRPAHGAGIEPARGEKPLPRQRGNQAPGNEGAHAGPAQALP